MRGFLLFILRSYRFVLQYLHTTTERVGAKVQDRIFSRRPLTSGRFALKEAPERASVYPHVLLGELRVGRSGRDCTYVRVGRLRRAPLWRDLVVYALHWVLGRVPRLQRVLRIALLVGLDAPAVSNLAARGAELHARIHRTAAPFTTEDKGLHTHLL